MTPATTTNPQALTPVPVARSKPTRPGPWRLSNIIDGRALRVQLTAAALDNLGRERETRASALSILHRALFRGRMIAQERLEAGADGLDTARLLAAVQDEVLSALFDFVTTHVFRSRNPTEGERLAVLATGGYGRGVLAPSSDIDLLFVRPYKETPWAESVIEYMLYALWDMGLRVGHAFRTVDECIRLAREDVTIKTSMLDARFLFGDRELADSLAKRFREESVRGRDAEFIEDKLAERDARHARMGSTRYVVEPNVKEGKGGLRDLQTLFWILKHMQGGNQLEQVLGSAQLEPSEQRAFLQAARFFWSVRCHLHFMTGREEDRLSFDLQPELAKRFGYADRAGRLGVERFMKRYFLVAREVGTLTRVLMGRLEAEQKKKAGGRLRRLLGGANAKPLDEPGFVIEHGRISVTSEEVFKSDPRNMLRLFLLGDRHGLDLHPDAFTLAMRGLSRFPLAMREDAEARALFLAVATSPRDPEGTLRQMNEAGLLGRFLPEFGRIVAQTQFNMYHHYTVDEHTLRAVGVIAKIANGASAEHAVAHKAFGQLTRRQNVYLAMLLHDTGKGRGDQQVEGARTARAASLRLGLSEADAEDVSWLVGHHLEMSETAQKRDISDPRTVAQFARLCGSLERLRALYVLTVADISAVGPGVYNAWKGQLLAELYHNTTAVLRGGRTDEQAVAESIAQRARARRDAVAGALGTLNPVQAGLEPAYWASFETEELVWQGRVLADCADGGVAVKARSRDDGAAATVLVSAPDRLGLFSDLTGAAARAGANIVAAFVFTSANGQAVDIFTLQDERGTAFAAGDPHRMGALERALREAALGKTGSVGPGPRRLKVGRREAAFLVDPDVAFEHDQATGRTIVDVTGRDRPGLLHELAAVLSANGLSIGSAHVGSYGERVFDAFYVTNTQGGPGLDETLKSTLKEQLLAVLRRDEPDAPATPARALQQARSAKSF